MRYNPPSNWPQPPAGWTPPPGWQPDPAWGPPPPGWQLWADDTPKRHTGRNVLLGVGAVLVLLIGIGAAVGGNSSPKTPAGASPSTTVGPTSAPAPSTTTAVAVATTTVPPTVTKTTPAVLGANEDAKKDVKITSCAKDATLGYVSAGVLITNHSSKPSNYLVTVVFESPDGSTQLGTGIAAANDLQPGQKAPETAAGLDQVTGKFTCRVSAVTRYASAG